MGQVICALQVTRLKLRDTNMLMVIELLGRTGIWGLTDGLQIPRTLTAYAKTPLTKWLCMMQKSEIFPRSIFWELGRNKAVFLKEGWIMSQYPTRISAVCESAAYSFTLRCLNSKLAWCQGILTVPASGGTSLSLPQDGWLSPPAVEKTSTDFVFQLSPGQWDKVPGLLRP